MDNIETTNQESQNNTEKQAQNSQKQIAGAIVLAAVIIGGAILLKGNMPARVPSPVANTGTTAENTVELEPVTLADRSLGNIGAPVTIVEYADFQCPFCEKFFNDAEKNIRDTYVKDGKVRFVYRDYAFLGEESTQSALAAMCASDQGKFWEYHDYLFTHQNGENEGAFADTNLRSFAKEVGLDEDTFNKCFDGGKHLKDIELEMTAATGAGVRGTPKGFILKGGKVVDTIDGAEPFSKVKAKIEKA